MQTATTEAPPNLEKYFEPKDLEAAKKGFMYPWKEEQTLHHLARAFSSIRMTPQWTVGNILFMFSFHFRYREKDRHRIWILNEKGDFEAKDPTWFSNTCKVLSHFTFSGTPITTIWFMFAYDFFKSKGHLLPSVHHKKINK
jgi:hypothetical protein